MHGAVIITTQMITLGKITSEEGDNTMKHIKLIGNFFKGLFKMIFCKHSYKEICRFTGRHKLENKEVVFDITYECVHCRKRLTVPMNEEHQLKMKN